MEFKILIGLISINIMREDFMYRSIHWINLLLIVLVEVAGFTYDIFDLNLLDLVINLAFLGIQFIALTAYFSIKDRRIVNITHHHIGLGDILYLAAISPVFSPIAFVLFTITALVFSIISVSGYTIITNKKTQSIPLASLIAIWLVVTGVLNHFLPGYFIESNKLLTSWLL